MGTGDAGREDGDAAICVAPVKGATPDYPRRGCNDCISIHAPAKGATSDASSGSIGRSYFNPRSREGSDQAAAKESRGGGNFNPRSREGSDVGRCNLERLTAISIHAPAKGATSSAGR